MFTETAKRNKANDRSVYLSSNREINMVVQQSNLDRLSAVIPLVLFSKIDVRMPALVRVLVDSETASKMLEMNIKNRRQRRASVEYMKHQIKNGEWRDDHPQPVIFSDKGRLIDGQHRLQAISELKIDFSNAVIVRVETGARDDVREYLDTGVPRTLDDRVQLVEDMLHNKLIAQLSAVPFNLKRGPTKRASPDDAREFFSVHHEAALFVAKNHKRDKGVGKIQVAYAAMEYYEIDKDKASEFYPEIFVVDSEIQQARILRDWLLRSSGTRGSQENSANFKSDVYHRAIAAMKAHKDGRKITILRSADW
jgi:hypothetical protein